MNVSIQQAKDATFIAKGPSNHWVVMDSVKQFGGSEAAARPMEMLLMSLGGCTAMDIISLLIKMRVQIDDFKIDVSGDRADQHPKVFTKIHLIFSFWGDNIDESKLKKAISLSQEKYCSITAMLAKSSEISYEIRINTEK